jgi:hypothetical protein
MDRMITAVCKFEAFEYNSDLLSACRNFARALRETNVTMPGRE